MVLFSASESLVDVEPGSGRTGMVLVTSTHARISTEAIRPQRACVVAPGVLGSKLEGQSVLLDLAAEGYFGVNRTGTRVSQALTASGSIQVAYQALPEEYAVDGPELEQDHYCAVRPADQGGAAHNR